LEFILESRHDLEFAAHHRLLPDPFDLLIAYIGLPDGSGLSLMRELRSRREQDLAKSSEFGLDAHLVKPGAQSARKCWRPSN
jgi:DNA-binding response OmpR family regulator